MNFGENVQLGLESVKKICSRICDISQRECAVRYMYGISQSMLALFVTHRLIQSVLTECLR